MILPLTFYNCCPGDDEPECAFRIAKQFPPEPDPVYGPRGNCINHEIVTLKTIIHCRTCGGRYQNHVHLDGSLESSYWESVYDY